MKNANVKLSVLAGLLKDWGVFNLYEETAYLGIHVEIFTSGKTYVESEECTVIHAGESGYKEFEGVYPTNGDDWDLTVLGDKFKNSLKPYFLSEETNLAETALEEMYGTATSYLNYKNQFSIQFLDDKTTTLTLGLYYDYRNNIVELTNSDESITKSLGALKGTTDVEFLYIWTKIINYSKFYNIYATDNSVLTPILTPLLYTEEDLEKYGLAIDEDNKVPYIKYLWEADFLYGRTGGFLSRNDYTYIKHDIYSYDATAHYYKTNLPTVSLDLNFGTCTELSMFYTNLNNYRPFWSEIEDKGWWEAFPRGFILFGIEDESSTTETFNKDDRQDTGLYNLRHDSRYTSIFKMADTTYDFNKKWVNCDITQTPLLALGFNGDSEGNIHIFNTWFPVKAKGDYSVSQEISYQEGLEGKYPKYIGLVAASLLANIYAYSETTGYSVSYIPDVIYLSDHATTYTKDVIYMAKPAPDVEPSSLILFHNYPFGDYITAIKDRLHKVSGEKYTSSDKNITLEMKSCIKNIPLQFRMGYIQPNLDLVGVKSGRARVKFIDGTEKDVILNSTAKDNLYLVDPGKTTATADLLGKNFKMRYLKSLEMAPLGNTLLGEFDTSIPEEKNEYILSTFKLDGSDLALKISSNTKTKESYAIVTNFYDNVGLHHFPKKEVIAPFAKLF